MGCFLGCFELKTKKNSRRARKKSLSREQNIGSYAYAPLDCEVTIKFDAQENNVSSDSFHHLKEKPKEPTTSKIKKKVSFNLNVKTYEPIPKQDDTIDYLSEGEEETRWEFDNQEVRNLASLHYGENYSNSIATNYRYKNYRDGYDDGDDDGDDDDDELTLDENDLYSDEIEDSEHESDDVSTNEHDDDGIEYRENFNWELNPLESYEGDGSKSELHSRERRMYLHSVLNPVENLTQWKKVKGKTKNGFAKFRKENLNPKQDEESFSGMRPNPDSLIKKMGGLKVGQHSERPISVDASFSGWNV